MIPKITPWKVGALLAAGIFEIAWRRHKGFASPVSFLAYGYAAQACGHLILRLSRLGYSGNKAIAERFVAGSLGLGALYTVLKIAGLPQLFTWLTWGFVLWSARMYSIRLTGLPRLGLVSLAMAWLVYYGDAITWFSAYPTSFISIDTPFFLSLAYGIERAVPVPDLVFSGALVNYHYGGEIFVALIRHLTGLQMHLAYFCTMTAFNVASCLLLPQILNRYLPARWADRGLIYWLAPLVGIVWAREGTHNLGTAVANTFYLFHVLQLSKTRSWRSGVLILVNSLFLVATKEIFFVFSAATCLPLCLLRFVRTGKREGLLIYGGATLISYLLFRSRQTAGFTLFWDHFTLRFTYNLLRENFFCLAATFLALGWAWKSKQLRSLLFVMGGMAPYLAGMIIYFAVKPVFGPEVDAFSLSWLLDDMRQFDFLGRYLMLVTLALFLLTIVAYGSRHSRRRARWTYAAFFAVGLGLLASALRPPTEKPYGFAMVDGVDQVIDLLKRVDVREGLIAANLLKWNHETPEWAAYFGHQFYNLRRGRWVTSQESYARVMANQKRLFETRNFETVQEIARSEGITHVIAAKENRPPWSTGVKAIFENQAYALYELKPLPAVRGPWPD